ncbi:MAG: MFS transporter [Planctomycetota bacterium]
MPTLNVAPSAISTPLTPAILERSLKDGLASGLGWAVMFGAGESSFPLFAAMIQAPDYFFGLLFGVPCLLGPLLQVWGANVLERIRNCRLLVLYSVAVQIISFIPLIVLPFLDPGLLLYAIFCLAVLCYYLTGHFAYPSWTAWISTLTPTERHADYFARFSRGVATFSLISKLFVGAALFWAGQCPVETRGRSLALVLAIAFAVAGIARGFSFWHLKRMYELPYEHTPDATFTFWQFIRRVRESNFVRFVFYIGFFNFGLFLSAPFFVPYVLYELHFAQWQWVVMDSMAVLATILALLYWGRFIARFGNKKTLKYTTYGMALIPLFWICSGNYYYLIIINFIAGAAWAGFVLSSYNYILEAATPAKRARCVAYTSIFAGVGSFVGSMVGAWLNQVLPPAEWSVVTTSNFAYLLIASGVMRIMAGLFFLPMFRELRNVQPLSLTQYFFTLPIFASWYGCDSGSSSASSADDCCQARPTTTQTESK